jgi:hypothetical protein
LNIIYQIIEPPLTEEGAGAARRNHGYFHRSLTANIEEIDANPDAYVRAAMDKVIKGLQHENQQEVEVEDFLLPAAGT